MIACQRGMAGTNRHGHGAVKQPAAGLEVGTEANRSGTCRNQKRHRRTAIECAILDEDSSICVRIDRAACAVFLYQ